MVYNGTAYIFNSVNRTTDVSDNPTSNFLSFAILLQICTVSHLHRKSQQYN